MARYIDRHMDNIKVPSSLIDLIRTINSLNNGKDMAGIELSGSPHFVTGSTVNAGASGQALILELEEMKKKIDAGTSFFVTPPLFDPSGIHRFLERVDLSKIKIIPTVLLLKSVGMARYIDRHMDNIKIPAAMIDRIQAAPDRVAECIKIAAENIAMIKNEGFGGVLVSTIGWESRLPEILA